MEHLRALDYPDNVSLESFRRPNFPLVVSLLKWLVERFDPEATLDGGVNTIEERISIIRSAAQFMVNNTYICNNVYIIINIAYVNNWTDTLNMLK